MIISESSLRLLIRKNLLLTEASWASSKIDTLEAIKIKLENQEKVYSAMGYANIDGKEVVVFRAPKREAAKIVKDQQNFPGADYVTSKKQRIRVDGNLHYTIDGSVLLRTEKGKTQGAQAQRFIYLPVTNKGIQYTKDKLDLSTASAADYGIEVLGIFGGVPGVGEPLDLLAAFLCIAKEPPDYFLAAISFLCCIPPIGTGAAFARSFVKKSMKEGPREAGKKLVETLSENGVQVTEEFIAASKSGVDRLLDFLLNDVSSEALERTLDMNPGEVAQGLEKVKEITDVIFEGMEEVVGDPKLALGAADKSAIKAAFKEATSEVLENLTKGQLKSYVKSFAVKHSKKVVEDMSAMYSKEWEMLIAEPEDFLTAYGELLRGKTYKIGPPVDTVIEFKSGQEFHDRIGQLAFEALGSYNEATKFIEDYVADLASKTEVPPLKPVTDEFIDKVIDNITESFKNIKFKFSGDPNVAGAGSDDFLGYLNVEDPSAPELFLSYGKFKDISNINQTLEHELLHHVDHSVIAALAMGNDYISKMYSNNFSSELIASSTLTNLGIKASDKFTLIGLRSGLFEPVMEHSHTGEWLINIIEETGGGHRTVDILSDIYNISKFHADALITIATRSGAYDKLSSPKLQDSIEYYEWLEDFVAYQGNSAEMFVRFQRVTNFAKTKGYDFNNPSFNAEALDAEIWSFFSEVTFSDLVRSVKDTNYNLFHIYDTIKNGNPNSESYKRAFEVFKLLVIGDV